MCPDYKLAMSSAPTITVVGLGYVGLPLAVALARRFRVIGLDVDAGRIAQIKRGHDRTSEVAAEALAATTLTVTAVAEEARGADIYIVTVPTPVDEANQPDLGAVLSATRTVAGWSIPRSGRRLCTKAPSIPGSPRKFAVPRSSACRA